jgi:hypothetical protein
MPDIGMYPMIGSDINQLVDPGLDANLSGYGAVRRPPKFRTGIGVPPMVQPATPPATSPFIGDGSTPSTPPPSFMQRLGAGLKSAAPDIITGAVAAGATPNIAAGGGTDMMRAVQAGMGAVSQRDLMLDQQRRQSVVEDQQRQQSAATQAELLARANYYNGLNQERAGAATERTTARLTQDKFTALEKGLVPVKPGETPTTGTITVNGEQWRQPNAEELQGKARAGWVAVPTDWNFPAGTMLPKESFDTIWKDKHKPDPKKNVVHFTGTDGKEWTYTTDETGTASEATRVPGSYQVHVPPDPRDPNAEKPATHQQFRMVEKEKGDKLQAAEKAAKNEIANPMSGRDANTVYAELKANKLAIQNDYLDQIQSLGGSVSPDAASPAATGPAGLSAAATAYAAANPRVAKALGVK